MKSDIEAAVRDALARAEARASSAGLTFTAELAAPASAENIANVERRLALMLPPDLRALLSFNDGMVVSTTRGGDRFTRQSFRAFACAQIVDGTEYLRECGYAMAGLCAVGAWDGTGDQFVAVAADVRASPVGGVLDTSADDPTSFEGPADYPDLRSWIGAQLAEFGRE